MDADKNVKLGDFGLARVLGENELFANTFVGTPYYMSPVRATSKSIYNFAKEQINGLIYNDRCDIWSFGCLIYEMASLNPPFEAPNQALLQKKIVEGKFSRIPEIFSEDLHKLIQMTLNTNVRNCD
jgi:NIMA (never in mitosis gene a)-related kinase